MDNSITNKEETEENISQESRHCLISEANNAFRRRIQAIAALFTVLFLLVWAEVKIFMSYKFNN